jgi:cyclic pyranopterin phosphate synthase
MTSNAASVVDRFERPLRSLRLSVTDRCNLRCQVLHAGGRVPWLPKDDILHFEEIVRLVRIFVTLGVHRVRLTGGEPLLRRDLATLVRLLAACLASTISRLRPTASCSRITCTTCVTPALAGSL